MDLLGMAYLIKSLDFPIESRKRLQKAIFFLELKGCDLGAEYTLHYYGPYSWDVAAATDNLRAFGVLSENPIACGNHTSYEYAITPDGREALVDCEKELSQKFGQYVELFKNLCKTDLRILELAATIAYYVRFKGEDCDNAKLLTSRFKNEGIDSQSMIDAFKLATSML